MNKVIIFLLLLSAEFLLGQSSYNVVYHADQEGKALSGSLEELISHVNNGNPIRVGWELSFLHPETKEKRTLVHWTDAGFVSVWGGHVFAQIKPIFQQGPGMDMPPSIFLSNYKPNGWVAILSTTGTMRQKYASDPEMIAYLEESMTKEEAEKFLKEQETMTVITKWATIK